MKNEETGMRNLTKEEEIACFNALINMSEVLDILVYSDYYSTDNIEGDKYDIHKR